MKYILNFENPAIYGFEFIPFSFWVHPLGLYDDNKLQIGITICNLLIGIEIEKKHPNKDADELMQTDSEE